MPQLEYDISDERAANLLTPIAYDPDTHLFMCDDSSLAMVFVMEPLSGFDDSVLARMQALLNLDWPEKSFLQFNMLVLDDLQQIDRQMARTKPGEKSELVARVAKRSREFVVNGAFEPLIKHLGLRPRNSKLLICAKIPTEEMDPSPRELDLAIRLRSQAYNMIRTIGFWGVRSVDDTELVEIMASILNRSRHASWRTVPVNLVHDVALREEVLDNNTSIEVEQDRLRIGSHVVRSLSVKRMPHHAYFGLARRYGGDFITGTRGIPGTYMITGSVYMLNQLNKKDSLSRMRDWATRSASGPMARFRPEIIQRKKDLDVVFESISEGDAINQFYLSIHLFGEDDDAVDEAVTKVVPYWSELGFSLMPDSMINLPILFHCIPLGPDRTSVKDFFRYRTLPNTAIATLLPCMGEWRGTGTHLLTLIGREGQVMSFSPFDSGTNYNWTVSAQSGSGKSFLVNEMIMSILAAGGRVWVVDVGRSYENLCEVLGGQFISFEPGKHICLNPFDTITDERIFAELEDSLCDLLVAMAAPQRGLDDYQMSGLKRILASTWAENRTNTTIDQIAAVLLAQTTEGPDGRTEPDTRLVDIGKQLYEFTSEGSSGRYFNGPSTIEFTKDFVVLEMEELKSKRNLQTVVLLQLIGLIQQAMYLGSRDQQKMVIIDEAWDLLLYGNKGIQRFAETGARRFRKYYGSLGVVTQSLEDLYQNQTGEAIAQNAATMIMLNQQKESLARLSADGKISANPALLQLLQSVHTSPGNYSEMYIRSGGSAGVGRLIVDEYRKILYSTNPKDIAAVMRYRREGMNIPDAIDAVLAERTADRPGAMARPAISKVAAE